MEILIFATLVVVGYLFGSRAEKRHYARIAEKEKQLLSLPVRCDRKLEGECQAGFLVYGSVVISADYFKVVVGGLRDFFGGRVAVYESLMDRARREATIRMKEMALRYQADEVVNFRVETSMLSDSAKNSPVCVEVFAYGTAIRK